jgi:hypothetical protein
MGRRACELLTLETAAGGICCPDAASTTRCAVWQTLDGWIDASIVCVTLSHTRRPSQCVDAALRPRLGVGNGVGWGCSGTTCNQAANTLFEGTPTAKPGSNLLVLTNCVIDCFAKTQFGKLCSSRDT